MTTTLHATKAIIFDMDGVLFHSNEAHEQAFQETLEKLEPAIAKQFAYATIAGMRTDEAFAKLLADAGRTVDPAHVARLTAEKRRQAVHKIQTVARIADYSQELIANLRQDYRLMLASSASQQTIDAFLAMSGYAEAFEHTLDGSSVLHAKPAPDIYQRAAKLMQLDHSQCLVIEDSPSGVVAAVTAGIAVIAVTEAEPTGFIELGAAAVVPNLRHVEQLLRIGLLT